MPLAHEYNEYSGDPPVITECAPVGRLAAAQLCILALGAALTCPACDGVERESVALGVACIRASDDNRVKLSASWASSTEVEIDGDLVTVRAEVPAGVSIEGTVRFRHYEYRCRRRDGEFVFLGYDVG